MEQHLCQNKQMSTLHLYQAQSSWHASSRVAIKAWRWSYVPWVGNNGIRPNLSPCSPLIKLLKGNMFNMRHQRKTEFTLKAQPSFGTRQRLRHHRWRENCSQKLDTNSKCSHTLSHKGESWFYEMKPLNVLLHVALVLRRNHLNLWKPAKFVTLNTFMGSYVLPRDSGTGWGDLPFQLKWTSIVASQFSATESTFHLHASVIWNCFKVNETSISLKCQWKQPVSDDCSSWTKLMS